MYTTNSADDIKIDVWDVYSSLARSQQQEVYDELKIRFEGEQAVSPFNLQDPVRRLELINALRSEGYKVEPA